MQARHVVPGGARYDNESGRTGVLRCQFDKNTYKENRANTMEFAALEGNQGATLRMHVDLSKKIREYSTVMISCAMQERQLASDEVRQVAE